MSFEDKVILITGAGSGIGADASRHLAKLGGKVALVDRNEKYVLEVAQQIREAGHQTPLVIVADVTVDAERIINETIKHFGKLNVLVNNAGIVKYDNVTNVRMDEFDRMFDINVRSVVKLTQLAVPYLQKTKGNIVNTASIAALQCEVSTRKCIIIEDFSRFLAGQHDVIFDVKGGNQSIYKMCCTRSGTVRYSSECNQSIGNTYAHFRNRWTINRGN